MTDRPYCQQRDACQAKGIGAHCRTCANAVSNRSEAKRERMAEGMRRFMNDPENKARIVAARLKAEERMAADPKVRAARQRSGREVGAKNIHHTRSAKSREKAGRAISATKLAHIPVECRPAYRALKGTGLSAVEREAIVLDSVPIETRRELRKVQEGMERREARRRRDAY